MSETLVTTPVADAPLVAPAAEVTPQIAAETPEDEILLTGAEEVPDDTAPAAPSTQDPEAKSADEDVEVEFEGAKYRIPKALNGAFFMQRDYTQKTQALADNARQLEAAKAEHATRIAADQAANEALFDAKATSHALRTQLKAWEAVKWDQLEAYDKENGTNEVTSAMLRYQRLKDAITAADTDLATKQSERSAADAAEKQRIEASVADEDAKLIRDGREYLTQKIPDWPTVAKNVAAFGAETFGFTPQEIAAVRDPRMFEVLHMAMVGKQAVAAAKTAGAIAKTQAVTPAIAVPGRAPPARDESKMTADEWIARRDKQVREKARRSR